MSSQITKELRTEHAFSGIPAPAWQVSARSYSWSPPTDVFETDASFVIRVEVAGMRESDFTIEVENNFLVISGMRQEAPERRAYQQMEIRFGEFSTAIEVPHGVNVSKAIADYQDGFLQVVLPKISPTTVNIEGQS